MFENAVKLLVCVMKNYNRSIQLGLIDNAYNFLAQYAIIKDLCQKSEHGFTVESVPIDSKEAVTGTSFLFAKLKFPREYYKTFPVFEAEGFKDYADGTVYEFQV